MAFLTYLKQIGRNMSDLVASLEQAQIQARLFQAMSNMTDEELAARGLKREQIPQVVFAVPA